MLENIDKNKKKDFTPSANVKFESRLRSKFSCLLRRLIAFCSA
jgi:hypothetical protein